MTKLIIVLTLCLALVLGTASAEAQSAVVELTAFNVGKADAILVRVGDKAYLIDAGLKASFSELFNGLERENITHLDGVFLTHVDKDHGGGMEKLAKSDIAIDAFYASPYFYKRSMSDNQIVEAATLRGMEVTWLYAGDRVSIDERNYFLILGPTELSEDDENDNSLVMLLVTTQGNALLPGDMTSVGEKKLLSSLMGQDISAAYLKVAHHGRDDASSAAFLQAASPQVAVISTDTIDEPRSAAQSVIDRLTAVGAQVYVTEGHENGIKVALRDGAAYLVTD